MGYYCDITIETLGYYCDITVETMDGIFQNEATDSANCQGHEAEI